MDRRRAFAAAALAVALAGAAAAEVQAHEFKLDSVMNAFVEVEPGELHLVIRAPLHVMAAIKFPLQGRAIDLAGAEPATRRALASLAQEIELWEDDRRLVAASAEGHPSLPSDRSFDRYEDARAHVAALPAAGTVIYADQGYFDAHFVYPIASPTARFAIRTRVAPELKEYLRLSIRFLPPGEAGRAMVITSGSGRVSLNPTWYEAAAGFVGLGVQHILTGTDHLLFLVCLVVPLSGWRQILSVVTAFTVAHSLTLLGSAFGLSPSGAWFPPFVETAIAASIVYMALENIVGVRIDRRLLLTGLFGLVHGFGFSYGLQENLQFAGTHLLTSLFAFNAGIEIGQLLVLSVMLPALAAVRRHVLAGRTGAIVLSALVAHTAWHWMIDRGDTLLKVGWPVPDRAGLVLLVLWAAGLLAAGALVLGWARRSGLSGSVERRLPS